MSDRDGDTEIYSMRGDGSKVRKLTSNKLDDEFPNWSPNGRAIVFHRARNDNFDVYRMRRDGGGVERLTTDPAGEGIPAFSPDGRMITFFSERGGSPDLFTMRRGGGGQTNRTSNKAFEFAPTGSPGRDERAGRRAGSTGARPASRWRRWPGCWSPRSRSVSAIREARDRQRHERSDEAADGPAGGVLPRRRGCGDDDDGSSAEEGAGNGVERGLASPHKSCEA